MTKQWCIAWNVCAILDLTGKCMHLVHVGGGGGGRVDPGLAFGLTLGFKDQVGTLSLVLCGFSILLWLDFVRVLSLMLVGSLLG